MNNSTQELIAQDTKSIEMFTVAKRVATSQAAILIEGETGSGKEVVAKYIHTHSPYHLGPYISVNCAALPEQLVESIMFGHEKGSFTGSATQHIGKFEQANKGSLLLDEISELPYHLQGKLLRVLQEKEVEKVGAKKTIKIDVRIIAATNKNLKDLVKKGEFRSDLYYRLNVIKLTCPPLRDRRLDIIPLAEYFIKIYEEKIGKQNIQLSEKAKEKLYLYDWPGNIRELENVIQHSVIMSENNQIEDNEIVLEDTNIPAVNLSYVDLKMAEAKLIKDILQQMNGSRMLTARKLNMSPRTLRYKLAKIKSLGINIL